MNQITQIYEVPKYSRQLTFFHLTNCLRQMRNVAVQ